MSTALLRFRQSHDASDQLQLDPGILAAAADASPEPMAVTENGELLYANRSFAQLSAQFEEDPARVARSPMADARPNPVGEPPHFLPAGEPSR